MKIFSKKNILGYANSNRLIVILSVVILVLVVIIIFGGVADKSSSNSTLINPTSLTDPSRQFYQADDLVINLQPLRDELGTLEKNANVSVYFEALNTGANISINKDAEFFPASLLKVPLVIAVVKKIERGEWEWGTKLELTEADKNKDFGTLWQQPTGTLFTVEELVKQTIINSDDTSYFMLLNNIDPNEIVKVQNYLGLYDFISNNMEISAKQYAPILRSLFSATYLTVQNAEKVLNWMSESNFNDYLAGGLPPATKFSHKIGVEDVKKVYLDAGIVYLPNRPYILIVMVKNYDAEHASAIMRDISQRVYKYMADYPKNI